MLMFRWLKAGGTWLVQENVSTPTGQYRRFIPGGTGSTGIIGDFTDKTMFQLQ